MKNLADIFTHKLLYKWHPIQKYGSKTSTPWKFKLKYVTVTLN